MPINGAVWRGKARLVVSAVGSLTGSSTGTTTWTSIISAYTAYAPDSIAPVTGFALDVSMGNDGSGGPDYGTAVYNGPGAPFGGLGLSAVGGGTLELLLEDLTFWCRNTGALPQIDATLYVKWNGTTVLGPIAISEVGAGVGPNYVPLFGYIGASGSCFSSTIGADPNDFSWDLTTTGSFDLAYEVQEKGSSTWEAMPLSILSNLVVTGSDTGSVHFEVYHKDHTEYSDTTVGSGDGSGSVHDFHNYDNLEGEIEFVPGGSRALSIMAPDYRSTIYVSGFPRTTSYHASGSVSGSGPLPPDGWDDVVPTITEIHPSLSAFKGSAGDASHVVFEPLGYVCYAAVRSDKRQSSKTFDVTYGPGGVATSSSNSYSSSFDGFQFPDSVEDYDTNPYLVDWQYHADPLMRYFGSWGSPYWKIGEWFPPADSDDEGGQVPQSQWPLDGGSVSPQYWKQTRTQWAGESSLPGDELTKKRTDLIGSAVEASALTLVYDTYWTGGFLRPLGWSRSPVMDCGTASTGPYEACPNSLELRSDSSPSWSTTEATLSFVSGGITVTPTDPSQTTAKVSLSLNGWDGPPFLYPQRCGSVTVGHDASALSLRFVSALGGSATVTGVTDGQTVDFPSGSDSGYSGTWGIDNGAGFTSDTGSDVAPGGQSLAAMADPSRAQSFAGLTGRQAKTLEFTVTFDRDEDDHALPATLEYPTFHRAEGTPTVVHLTGAQSAILWPNGPAILYGNEFYWDGVSFNVPPLLTGLGYSPTIVDAIGWRRAFLQGVHPLYGGTTGTGTGTSIPALTTELAERYTTFEGQSIAQVDQMSWTFVLPTYDESIRLLLGNTYQEVPPIAMFMARSRAAGAYAPTGDLWGGVYDLAKEPRDVVSPTDPLKVYDGSTLVSSAQTAPLGWKIERYSPAVENDETGWLLKQGDTTVASVRPFHGWLWVGKFGAQGKILAFLSRRDGRLHRLIDKDGSVSYGATDTPSRASWTDRDLSTSATEASLTRGDGSNVLAGLLADDGVTVRVESSEGLHPPLSTMNYGPATSHDIASIGDGRFVVGRIDGGTVKFTIASAKDLSIVDGPYSTNVTGLSDEATIRFDKDALAGNRSALVVLIGEGADTTAYLTEDYQTLTP